MKKNVLFVFLLFSLISNSLFSQTYGNEWINYNQTYYKFTLINEGIYKIDYQTLADAGINMNSINSANFQLFGRDKEQPIYIVDQGDNSFDDGDYFMFYFEKNNGWLDSAVYEDPNTIGNPAFCMFNDSINYFFSISTTTNNLRFILETTTQTGLTVNFPTVSPYCIVKTENASTSRYNEGKITGGIFLSQFSPGEGLASGLLDKGSTTTYNFNTPNKYSGAGAPQVTFHGKSNSNSDADATLNPAFNHHLVWTLGSGAFTDTLTDTIFGGYKQIITNKTIPLSYINNGTTSTNFFIKDDRGAVTDFQSFSYMSLTYPRLTNLNGVNKDKFTVVNNPFQAKAHLELTSTGITNPLMFAIGTNNSYFVVPISAGGNNWSALVPTDNQNKEVIFQDASLMMTVSSISPVNGTGVFTNFINIDLDSADIMVYHPSLDSASQVYANYRRSFAGGSYNVIMANIEELYLQFGGGIPKHNAAVRRFSHYIYNNSTIKPVALTLLGKGFTTAAIKDSPYLYPLSLIPPFGHPGSDICYTSALEGSGLVPLIPTGRVSIQTQEQLIDYLEKLKTYEQQQNQSDVYNNETKDWQKQIIHFSGGNPGNQANTFFGYMEGFRTIIENAYFAGHVTTYRKISGDPLEPSLLVEMRNKLISGVSLINFFGHSSSSGFDLSIDSPDNWENVGKYPIVIGNGCHSGDIFNSDYPSFGEQLIRTPSEGAIAYIASTDTEYDVSVEKYCKELYNQMSPKNYGLPISHQIQKTIEELESTLTEGEYLLKGTMGATNLDGDPLLKLNWHAKPEIDITQQSLYFLPEEVSLDDDSIEINLVIKNLGKAITDTFYVEIKRDFPNVTEDSIYFVEMSHLNYIDSISLKIPTQANIAVGVNNIEIKIDNPSDIPEQYDEVNNNQLTKQLFLKMDAIIPIWPYEFAVIPNDTVTLKASTVNPIGPLRTYLFELDTTDEFNSPKKLHATFSGLGGIKEVKFNEWLDVNNSLTNFTCGPDSTVYFWRTAIDSSTLFWNESSFQYIEGKEGWGQDHIFQFKNNDYNNVTYDKAQRKRLFEPVSKTLDVILFDNTATNASNYKIDEQTQEYGNRPEHFIYMAVIDPVTLSSWYTNSSEATDLFEGHSLLNYNDSCFISPCRGRQEKYFYYLQNNQGLNDLNTAINTLIPTGHYILLYAAWADYAVWSAQCPGLFNTISSLGGVNINPLAPERAFIFFSHKGFPAEAAEVIATTAGETITYERIITSGQYLGNEISPLIGPSSDWKTLYWKQYSLDSTPGDTTTLTVELYNTSGGYSSSFDTVFTANDSIINLSNLINATNYPYIKLKATYQDEITFTPAQNDRWHVLFSPMPEAAIDGSNGYTWIPDVDTLNEGEEFQFAIDIKNISDVPMDSLLVSYYVEDENHVKNFIAYPRQDSLRVDQTMRDTITFSTLGLPGINSLWVEVNPYINGSLVQTDQLEQYHFNNLLQIPFYVVGDDVNPILDVTFDGRHILNGDIVNPKSEIYITLKDDNDFLVMNNISDTTLFGIFLTSPDGVQKRIPFTDGNGIQVMQWIPAESQFKKFKIIYPAAFDQDGIYELLVQGSDRSGNLSGELQYRIQFEVIHESSITALMNYPNPFSTSTRFVFTLTGSEIPDEFLIQIMTVSGKVVREITEDQLGPIYIGRNITEYAWDGTDEFGDPLANGVYLYRVLSEMNGEEIKHRDSGADQYFKKEFGKMYIIR